MNQINSETQPEYHTNPTSDDALIQTCLKILESRIRKPETYIKNPEDTKNYLKLELSEKEHEVFAVLFLDSQHGVIAYEEMFQGTIDEASVYPREIIKKALKFNAAALIIAHNHPSGNPESSDADITITNRIKDAANLLEIRLLDHIIVGGVDTISLAEQGYL